ncbi:MAG: imidazole glycerol phosphate synthase subunit HisF [Ignavibacteriae bacterium HGW-Ignavibacteriae-2]|jgi:cyclase|nr:AglZ/HisF2 family acetamidino modification protein [Bacteroidota bacterium]PKL88799.1 MAG: imidazole glycerol phosphate synthase subunit HisF [Ignavibacteriae bacterium HGW-Ignavibacteriae-2]
MFIPRLIPVLLLKNKGLVKTKKFKDPQYIGDPINAVRIFNDLKADELLFLDITASKEKRTISIELVKNIGDEAFMPFGVGGGIKSLNQIEAILRAGAEKIVINSYATENLKFIEDAVKYFGGQSIVVSVDVKKSIFNQYQIYSISGKKKNKIKLLDYLRNIELAGAGELIINSIDNDGMMLGYDLNLIKLVSESVKIPVVACGGAGELEDFRKGFYTGNAHALAAGSLFVYHGPRRAVLVNYPEKSQIKELFKNG